MFDPNREDFNARVLRLQRDHALGRRFEAADLPGQSAMGRRAVRKRTALRVGLFLMAFAFGMKGALHHSLGPDGYAGRVALLEDGTPLGAVQGVLMRADPVTVLVSTAIAQVRVAL